MYRWFLAAIISLAAMPVGWAEQVSKEQIKGLDEQVQEIKTDVLGIAAELNRLEEKLLYPSNTQVALFVSLARDAKFRLDALEVQINGKAVAHHLYTFKELEALQQGGVQRIYTGNIKQGEHALQVSFIGKATGGGEVRQSATYTIKKDVAPKLVGITIAPNAASQGIAFKDW